MKKIIVSSLVTLVLAIGGLGAYYALGSAGVEVKSTGSRYGVPYRSLTVTTSAQLSTANLFTAQLWDVTEPGIVEAIGFTNGSNDAGNWVGAIYGPVVTEASIVNAPLLVKTNSTAVGNAGSIPEYASVTETVIPKGRYYVGVQFSDTTGVNQFIRSQNSSIVGEDSASFTIEFNNLPSVATTTDGITSGASPLLSVRFKQP